MLPSASSVNYSLDSDGFWCGGEILDWRRAECYEKLWDICKINYRNMICFREIIMDVVIGNDDVNYVVNDMSISVRKVVLNVTIFPIFWDFSES